MQDKKQDNQKKEPKSLAKRVWQFLSSLVVALVVVLALLIVGPRLLGFLPFGVLSGSMEPAYPVGSLLYVQRVDASLIKAGDPITFVSNNNLVVVTHRVVRVDSENKRFYTKGDANNAEDIGPVYFPNLIGRPVYSLPLLGYLAAFIMTRQGMIISIAFVLLLFLVMYIPEIFQYIRKNKAKEQSDESASDKS